ncbi:hypothetical protein [Bathymodiolus japonicus methanotrophic gill symbiont]|uniref:hypothetical protein n=1 Tax=Bathymodiolus japonicus methanotrophic gill symbiont TaxID=113269 RepID=UPI001C8E9268|nr:hypothetical protein [Bathymodiolus japonicus methanotrophic gill symbiont]
MLLSRAASTRRISEFPCRLSGTKNHHFAKLRFHDFQRGKVYAAGGIYALNLRSGLLRFLCLVTNGTQRHQEIPVLRDHTDSSIG